MANLKRLADLWNHNGRIDGKIYSTGEVASILGISSRSVLRRIASGKLKGVKYNKPSSRRTLNGVTPKDIIEYMASHNLPFETIADDDYDGQKAILSHIAEKARLAFEEAKKKGDIFRNVTLPVSIKALEESLEDAKQKRCDQVEVVLSADIMPTLYKSLKVPECLYGYSKGAEWAKFFVVFSDLMLQRNKVFVAFEKQQKNKK